MKEKLFDIVVTAHTGQDGVGAFDVRIVLRDGTCIGFREEVTILEAMEYATEILATMSTEMMQSRSN